MTGVKVTIRPPVRSSIERIVRHWVHGPGDLLNEV